MKKLKNVSCEYDRLNGWNSTLQAAWYIRHVRIICFFYTVFIANGAFGHNSSERGSGFCEPQPIYPLERFNLSDIGNHSWRFSTFLVKSWKTSNVSATVWMVETQRCKLRGTSDTFVPIWFVQRRCSADSFLTYFTSHIREFRNFFFGTQVSKTNVRLGTKAGSSWKTSAVSTTVWFPMSERLIRSSG